MASKYDSAQEENMFRPPLARGMQVLDRAFFQRTVLLKAARVYENKNISKIRSRLECSKDALRQDRLANVYPDPDAEQAKLGKKCILLRPDFLHANVNDGDSSRHNSQAEDSSSPQAGRPHSPVLAELVDAKLISVIPYHLHLSYDYWTYHDIISAILPQDATTEIPSGFSQVGHVVHMNLRDAYLPYKNLIASIIIDKNPGAKTVINKIDDVGEENEFRTFKYEVLAGEDDLNVAVSEGNCEFRFDYAKVYWNPRLSTEHRRLVDMFKEGEAVCDVMAGIGPFAVPAGKKGVFVWANDLNPDSYLSLTDAVKRNKVGEFVAPFNTDGRKFIQEAAARLLDEEKIVEIKRKVSRKEAQAHTNGNEKKDDVVKRIVRPKTFQHYVLNLPATALTFLPSFVGLYPPELRQKLPSGSLMPLVHVYCFSTKDELEDGSSLADKGGLQTTESDATGTGSETAEQKICAEISQHLGYTMKPGKIGDETPGAVEIWDVRDVAPKKRMFCASFRVPEEVAYRVV